MISTAATKSELLAVVSCSHAAVSQHTLARTNSVWYDVQGLPFVPDSNRKVCTGAVSHTVPTADACCVVLLFSTTTVRFSMCP